MGAGFSSLSCGIHYIEVCYMEVWVYYNFQQQKLQWEWKWFLWNVNQIFMYVLVFWSSIYLENLIKFKFEPRYNQQMQVQLQCIF